MFSRSNGSWSLKEMKSPEVSIRFSFCSSVSLCGTNREQISRLPKSWRTMACAVCLLKTNSSAINLNVSHRSYASICRTFSIIYGVLLVDGRSERGESISTFRKHIFCSLLPSRTPAPTFQASPLQFSPICSRT